MRKGILTFIVPAVLIGYSSIRNISADTPEDALKDLDNVVAMQTQEKQEKKEQKKEEKKPKKEKDPNEISTGLTQDIEVIPKEFRNDMKLPGTKPTRTYTKESIADPFAKYDLYGIIEAYAIATDGKASCTSVLYKTNKSIESNPNIKAKELARLVNDAVTEYSKKEKDDSDQTFARAYMKRSLVENKRWDEVKQYLPAGFENDANNEYAKRNIDSLFRVMKEKKLKQELKNPQQIDNSYLLEFNKVK